MRSKKAFFLLVLVSSLCWSAMGQTRLMTYNLRYANPNDQENYWENRKAEVAEMIRYYHPGILGIQEGLHAQVAYLDEALAAYSYVGVGRDDGKQKGEYAAIFYDVLRFIPLQNETFWLSETPDEISVGWDASMERICTYGLFADRQSGEKLHVFNCHFDHRGPVSRRESARLLLKKLKEWGLEDEQVVIMGDLNAGPQEEPLQVLTAVMTDARTASLLPPYGPAGTYNGFDIEQEVQGYIDHILVKNLNVRQYTVVDDRRKNNLWLSDHLPVMVETEK